MSVDTVNDRYRRVTFKGKKKALKVSDQGKDMVNSLAVSWRMDYEKRMTLWEGCVTATGTMCPDCSCSYVFGSYLQHLAWSHTLSHTELNSASQTD